MHKVAFRSGLANSLYCPSHLVGKHTPEILQSYVAANLRADNATVVGVGIAHDRLVAYAQSLALKSGQSAPVAASKVNGGEIRLETGGPLAFVAVAASGASLADTKKMIAFALLQRFLGVGRINCLFLVGNAKVLKLFYFIFFFGLQVTPLNMVPEHPN